MARQMAQDDRHDAVPDAIPTPDILGDFNVWSATHWTEQQIHTQPSVWLSKILMAHAESNRIQAELFEDVNRADSRGRGRPINDAEIEDVRASNPKLANLPAAALRKLYRKRNG